MPKVVLRTLEVQAGPGILVYSFHLSPAPGHALRLADVNVAKQSLHDLKNVMRHAAGNSGAAFAVSLTNGVLHGDTDSLRLAQALAEAEAIPVAGVPCVVNHDHSSPLCRPGQTALRLFAPHEAAGALSFYLKQSEVAEYMDIKVGGPVPAAGCRSALPPRLPDCVPFPLLLLAAALQDVVPLPQDEGASGAVKLLWVVLRPDKPLPPEGLSLPVCVEVPPVPPATDPTVQFHYVDISYFAQGGPQPQPARKRGRPDAASAAARPSSPVAAAAAHLSSMVIDKGT